MGDRCHMIITCRESDADRFLDLGFYSQVGRSGPTLPGCVVVEDHEANFGHAGDLPDDVPYFGAHGAGSTYGPALVACDGHSEPAWASASEALSLVAAVDVHTGEVDEASLRHALEYVSARKRAMAWMGAVEPHPGRACLFRYEMNVCDREGREVSAWVYVQDRVEFSQVASCWFEFVRIVGVVDGGDIELFVPEQEAVREEVAAMRSAGNFGERVSLIVRVPDPPTK